MGENQQQAVTGSTVEDFDLPADMFRSGDSPAETFELQMWKKGVDGLAGGNTRAKFTTVADGGEELAIFEGDIRLGTPDEVRDISAPGAKGIVVTGGQYRWPGGRVPYVLEDAVAERARKAMQHWEERTPIRFVERTDADTDYISFEQHRGCWSSVGRQGGKQIISLDTYCKVGPAIHEIGHTLGLWHEQSRADRDDHITIRMDRVAPQHRHNFDKHIQDGDDVGSYDYGSIMHYPETAFSATGEATIVTKAGKSIGQRNGLSAGDIGSIRSIYPDLDWSQYETAPTQADTGV
jgi:hypothetical protein